MYAIIETGGKQYRVSENDIIDIELLGVEAGNKVEFQNVLFVNENGTVKIGNPQIEGYVVHGELVEEVKGKKVIAYKYKRRKNYHRKVGHRQNYSRVKITAIKAA